ncbi:MAG: hypothetical protein E7181_04255 [Erysipelotrichaceae bacterium]|nr:hypothetical protein [Erysipelotrichaceae bacterium]
MIEQRYVKKRKRRKLVAFFSGVATLGMATLILVSFLGKYSGSFTVSLNKGNVKISLCTTENFGDGEGEGDVGEVGSYLKVDNLKPFDQMTYLSLPDDSIIDTQDTTWEIGENSSSTLNFFKYTFFVKNMGTVSAEYNLRVRILDSTAGTGVNSGRLDNLLRVMVYANDGLNKDAHERTVYAMSSEKPNVDLEGNATYSEYISLSPSQARRAHVDFPGFATPFESDDVVVTLPVTYFEKSNMNRYTIVTWIEGEDRQTAGQEAPEGASIKLGVEINAYENE